MGGEGRAEAVHAMWLAGAGNTSSILSPVQARLMCAARARASSRSSCTPASVCPSSAWTT